MCMYVHIYIYLSINMCICICSCRYNTCTYTEGVYTDNYGKLCRMCPDIMNMAFNDSNPTERPVTCRPKCCCLCIPGPEGVGVYGSDGRGCLHLPSFTLELKMAQSRSYVYTLGMNVATTEALEQSLLFGLFKGGFKVSSGIV